MRLILFYLLLLTTNLFANNLDSLLKEYKEVSESSLKTVDEKLGHVLIYSQKDIRLMQYENLNDILKELPLLSLNTNRFGNSSLSLAGTKTTVSGFFRFFINDHEISSAHTQSASLTWGNLPLDFVDYIEIYYGESSFSSGNESGIYFIRIYTKSAKKENGGKLVSTFSNNNSNSQSLTYSSVFGNDWSYLIYLNDGQNNNSTKYNNQTLNNDTLRRYLYLDINNPTTKINIGYTDLKKDNYMGMSIDAVPNSGETKSEDLFFDITKYFLDDKSIKATISYDVNNREYQEENNEGLAIIPILNPVSNITQFSENLKLTKTNAYLSKTYKTKNNELLLGINLKKKEYKVKNREYLNNNILYSGVKYNSLTKESTSSFLIQDSFHLNDKTILIANSKFNKHNRDSYIDDSKEEQYRGGIIYTPTKNFGVKGFYTKTSLLPTFYNYDFASNINKKLNSQKYKFLTVEAVYANDNSKYGITYHNVKIDDFIYFLNHPFVPGFINIDHQIKTEGIILNYEYIFSKNNKLYLNYYTTKSSEKINNSDSGAYIKFMGQYNNLEYFTSLIYRNKYTYAPTTSNQISVAESYDVSIGASYNFTKNLSFSIKGNNLLDKSTKSLYTNNSLATPNFALEDAQRSVNFTVKWVF